MSRKNDDFNEYWQAQSNEPETSPQYSNCNHLLFFKRVIAQEKCRDRATYYLSAERVALHSLSDCLAASRSVIEQAEKCFEMNKP